MKRFNKYLIAFTLFVLSPMTTKAIVCNNESKVVWQSKAQNVAYTYDVVEKNGNITFNITFSNIANQLMILDVTNNKMHDYSSKELTLTGYQSKKNYRFEIYTNEFRCSNTLMHTLYVNLPAYNRYSTDNLCKGIENYYLCQKWADITMTYDEWKIKVNSYIDSLNITEEPNKNDTDNSDSILYRIVDAYGSVYYIVFPIIIILGIAYIVYYNKKHDLF